MFGKCGTRFRARPESLLRGPCSKCRPRNTPYHMESIRRTCGAIRRENSHSKISTTSVVLVSAKSVVAELGGRTNSPSFPPPRSRSARRTDHESNSKFSLRNIRPPVPTRGPRRNARAKRAVPDPAGRNRAVRLPDPWGAKRRGNPARAERSFEMLRSTCPDPHPEARDEEASITPTARRRQAKIRPSFSVERISATRASLRRLAAGQGSVDPSPGGPQRQTVADRRHQDRPQSEGRTQPAEQSARHGSGQAPAGRTASQTLPPRQPTCPPGKRTRAAARGALRPPRLRPVVGRDREAVAVRRGRLVGRSRRHRR